MKRFLLVLILLIATPALAAPPAIPPSYKRPTRTILYNTPGSYTYTPSPGATKIDVLVCGAGGGGAALTTFTSGAGGTGGNGFVFIVEYF